MNCKNCNAQLHPNSDYCHVCGAKVIRNRLTFKNLFEHISETFFNYDNKLLRTIIDLFRKPEEVIGGYISGVRKRYVNPISYLGIALTLSGISLFIMKKTKFSIDFDVFNQGVSENYVTKIQSLTNEYSSFIYLSYIPLFAISSWLFLKSNGYNFTERILTFIYAFAQYSIVIFVPSIIAILFLSDYFMTFSFLTLAFLVSYCIYIMYKISRLRGIELIAQMFVFSALFGMLYMFYSVGMVIILLITGEISFQDFIPKK